MGRHHKPDPEAERRMEQEARLYAIHTHCATCNRIIYADFTVICDDDKLRCIDCAEDFRQIVREEKRTHR